MPSIAAIPHAVFTTEDCGDFIARRRAVFEPIAALADAIAREALDGGAPVSTMGEQLRAYLTQPVLATTPEWFEQERFST